MNVPATAPSGALPRRAWVEQIMGLPISIHLRGPELGSPRVEAQVQAVFSELRHADDVFSTYRADSDLSRWENGELCTEDADRTLIQVFALCAEAGRRTDGWFDPRGLPDPTSWRPRYDPSGLVKGWAVERASRQLRALADHDWCLNAGGDIAVSTLAANPAWRVGIEDPTNPQRVAVVVPLRAGAIATSSTAHRGAHIIDPFSGRPAAALRAVTVVGPSLLWADVYATAASAQGMGALEWLERLPGYEAIFVGPPGLTRTTSGWLFPPED